MTSWLKTIVLFALFQLFFIKNSSAMASVAKRFVVQGQVQGVCFRANTRQKAEDLDLMGHAKNLSNGDVEVIFYFALFFFCCVLYARPFSLSHL